MDETNIQNSSAHMWQKKVEDLEGVVTETTPGS
jgi:hypothetical protein